MRNSKIDKFADDLCQICYMISIFLHGFNELEHFHDANPIFFETMSFCAAKLKKIESKLNKFASRQVIFLEFK